MTLPPILTDALHGVTPASLSYRVLARSWIMRTGNSTHVSQIKGRECYVVTRPNGQQHWLYPYRKPFHRRRHHRMGGK